MTKKLPSYTKIYYHKNGVKRAEFTFNNRTLEGPCRGWNVNGQISFEGNCGKKGKHGIWHNYDTDGNKNYEYWFEGKQIVTPNMQDTALPQINVSSEGYAVS